MLLWLTTEKKREQAQSAKDIRSKEFSSTGITLATTIVAVGSNNTRDSVPKALLVLAKQTLLSCIYANEKLLGRMYSAKIMFLHKYSGNSKRLGTSHSETTPKS